jgi:Mor family transcriptional regulator
MRPWVDHAHGFLHIWPKMMLGQRRTTAGEASTLKYQNAESVLPARLVAEIQKYVQGTQLYIPKQNGKRLGWGERNGQRRLIKQRNQEIRQRYREGASIEELMAAYHLGYESIRKIIYQRESDG